MDCKFIICACAYPEFLLLQAAYLKHNLKQTFTFCVVDDSDVPETNAEFVRICAEQGWEYLKAPFKRHLVGNPSGRHASAINHGFRSMSMDGGHRYYGILDNDLLLVAPLDLDTVLSPEGPTALVLRQTREHIHYFWPGCFIYSAEAHPILPMDWSQIIDDGVLTDSGGGTYYAWQNPDLGIKALELTDVSSIRNTPEEWDATMKEFLPLPIQHYYEFQKALAASLQVRCWSDVLYERSKGIVWFHVRDISNWEGNPALYFQRKLEAFKALPLT